MVGLGQGGGDNEAWLNDGTGTFGHSGQSLVDSWSYAVALGDVDGDGNLDALAGNYETSKVWLNLNHADLSLGKTVNPPTAAVGQIVTYTLLYVNHGPHRAYGIVISDAVPTLLANVSYLSHGAAITPTGTVPYYWRVANLEAWPKSVTIGSLL